MSDYDETVDFELEQAQKLLTSAQYFVEQIEAYLLMHPKLAVDSFLEVFQDQVRILYKGYQVICEKVEQCTDEQSVKTEL